MAASITNEHPDAKIELIRGGSGNFIVTVGDDTLWHKRQMGDEFPEHSVIIEKLATVT